MAPNWKTWLGSPGSGDDQLFLRLRWILGLWLAVTLGVFWKGGWGWSDVSALGLLLLFVLSQLALWKMPQSWLKGPQRQTSLFLLDLFFAVAALLMSGLASPSILATLFLTVFVSALVRRVTLGLLVGLAATGVYAAFKLQGPEGFVMQDVRQLLDVPIIFLCALHTSIIVADYTLHQDMADALDADNQTLSKKLGTTASELKARIQFINSSFDAVPAAVLVVDADGFVRTFNNHAESLLEARRMSVLDRPLKDIPFLEPLRLLLKAAGGEGGTTGWIATAKGAQFYAALRAGAARDAENRLLNLAVFVLPATAPEGSVPPPLPVKPEQPAPVDDLEAIAPSSEASAAAHAAAEAAAAEAAAPAPAGETPAGAAPAAPAAAAKGSAADPDSGEDEELPTGDAPAPAAAPPPGPPPSFRLTQDPAKLGTAGPPVGPKAGETAGPKAGGETAGPKAGNPATPPSRTVQQSIAETVEHDHPDDRINL